MELQITAGDPLLFDFELPLRTTFYPVGFPVDIITNSPLVLEAAQESWGLFQKSSSEPPVQIRLGVLPSSQKECPPPPTCRGRRNLITQIVDVQNFMISDTRAGFAFGWVTEAAAQNRGYLRYHFLEGTAWLLLQALYLTPIHAACVELDGHGVLLCGDSGAGKSSLSYACARDGWKFLSDDSSCLVRKKPGRIVVGNPYQIRFRESAVELFPELIDRKAILRPSGEMAIELPTTTRYITTLDRCSVDFIVFLNRKDSLPNGIVPFSRERALSWLEQVVCYGEEHVRQSQRLTLQKLLGAEIVEMRYKKLDSATRLLEELVTRSPTITPGTLMVAEERENG
jgi:hypothetical protein